MRPLWPFAVSTADAASATSRRSIMGIAPFWDAPYITPSDATDAAWKSVFWKNEWGRRIVKESPERESFSSTSPCTRRSSAGQRSEEHTSELQSLTNLVCRLLL